MCMYGNPMYNYLNFMRQIFLWQTNPEPITIALCAGWALVMLALGYFVFHKLEHKFILYI